MRGRSGHPLASRTADDAATRWVSAVTAPAGATRTTVETTAAAMIENVARMFISLVWIVMRVRGDTRHRARLRAGPALVDRGRTSRRQQHAEIDQDVQHRRRLAIPSTHIPL